MRKVGILGSDIDLVTQEETIEEVQNWLDGKNSVMRILVTAYSEFLVKAREDAEFAKVLEEADLVVPDGISVLAAARYQQRIKGQEGVTSKFILGLKVGLEIIKGRVGRPVTGVWLFEALAFLAARTNRKVFLLGSKKGVVQEAKLKLKAKYPELKIEVDSGEEKVGEDPTRAAQVISKINRFRPDFLFVAYNPIVQEKWLMANKKRLKARVGMGVGGTFDEFVGLVAPVPRSWERHGLKWLWRFVIQPQRLPRIAKAFPVFPWLVFKESLKS